MLCVCACTHACLCHFVWKSLRSIFCGKTEGSGRVDYTQYLMAHYLFMSPTSHGSLGTEAGRAHMYALCSSEVVMRAALKCLHPHTHIQCM